MNVILDMIRLTSYVSEHDFNYFIKKREMDPRLEYYQLFRCDAFKHNFRYKCEIDKSFWFGYHHNFEKSRREKYLHNLTIEFNPAKINIKEYDIFEDIFITFNKYLEVRRIDIAIDLIEYEAKVIDLIIDKKLKRNYKEFYYSNIQDKTIYVGNNIKIYNKAKELKLNRNYIRIEYTIECEEDYNDFKLKEFELIDLFLPKQLNIKQLNIKNLSSNEDKTLRAIIYAVLNGYDVNMLSRVYKEKVFKNLEEYKINIEFDFIKKEIEYQYYNNIYKPIREIRKKYGLV